MQDKRIIAIHLPQFYPFKEMMIGGVKGLQNGEMLLKQYLDL